MKRRRGIVQIAILHLLKEESMHGYRIMKELEARAGGHYSASAGAIYPALQELLEREMIDLEESASDKKIYSIKDKGLARLEAFANRREGDFWEEWKERFVWKRSEEAAQLNEAMEGLKEELRRAVKRARGDREKTIALTTRIKAMTESLKRERERGEQA